VRGRLTPYCHWPGSESNASVRLDIMLIRNIKLFPKMKPLAKSLRPPNRFTTLVLIFLGLQYPDALLGSALEVGSRKQLFIDHKFIESTEDVVLTMNPPARTGQLLITADAPWEKDLRVASYSTVIAEDGLIRVWYNIVGKQFIPRQNPDFMGLAYAESRDGIHFTKPILNLVEYQGSKANNLVLPGDPKLLSIGGGSVQRDDNPNCPPGERYKTWMKIYPKRGVQMHGPSRVWVSPDGIHWTLSEKKITGLRATDTQLSWFWEPRIGRYVVYSREWVQFTDERQIRMASYNESDDLFNWENTRIILEPDAKDFAAVVRPLVVMDKMFVERERLKNLPQKAPNRADEEKPASTDRFADNVPPPGAPVDVYGPGVMPYREADSVYVALAAMFHHSWQERGTPTPDRPDTGDVALALSRDGKNFNRVGSRKPFLGVGPAGAFDSRWLWPMPGLVRQGNEIWIYYYGMNIDHSWRVDPQSPSVQTGISRAVLRLDGFMSADFDYTGGTILTPAIRFEGSRLELNLDTGAGGLGRIEIQDEQGRPIPGFTLADADFLNGNSVRMTASWKGNPDVSSLAGKPVRLLIKMRSAKLYAFQFKAK
jgi:hypothetical protein